MSCNVFGTCVCNSNRHQVWAYFCPVCMCYLTVMPAPSCCPQWCKRPAGWCAAVTARSTACWVGQQLERCCTSRTVRVDVAVGQHAAAGTPCCAAVQITVFLLMQVHKASHTQ